MAETDVAFGRRVVGALVDLRSNPPLVKRKFQSLGRLHGELAWLGAKLVGKKSEQGAAGSGWMLFYLKENVLIRIKTWGSGGKFRGGVPHLVVSLLSGARDKTGEKDLRENAEVGKFHIGGGIVNHSNAPKATGNAYMYDQKRNPVAKSANETWADGVHFDFPDFYCDDGGLDLTGVPERKDG
jgi:hypothetical protein